MSDKEDIFTLEEVTRAYEVAHGEIIGAHLILGVRLKMDVHKLSEVKKTDLSDSERECIEWGLTRVHDPAKVGTVLTTGNVMNNGRVGAILDRLQEQLRQDPGEFEDLLDAIEEVI